MASITSSEFNAPLQALLLGKNMRVTPAEQIRVPSIRRSGSPQAGLGACWGWTPGGDVALDCRHRIDSVNKIDREFLIDCVAFTTPSKGHLRLYVRMEPGVPNITMPLVVVPNVRGPNPDQTYQLSQVIELGQTVFLPYGAREFSAPEGTSWNVIQSPFNFVWPATSSSLKLTTVTTALTYLIGPGYTQGAWTIGI